jgi:hypothetical protein
VPRMEEIRPVLLFAPYTSPKNLEVRSHLRSGYRTTGLSELTLEDAVYDCLPGATDAAPRGAWRSGGAGHAAAR